MKPGPGEFVIGREAGKLVPALVDAVYARIVGAVQFTAELQVIRRVREYHVDGFRRQIPHDLNAVADLDRILPAF